MNSPGSNDSGTEHYWESSWEEHERLQLLRMARLPLADKLIWLEEAHRMVLHMATVKSRQSKDLLNPK
jgi:hypothetical protein